ncbi:family 1 glycosylhydrolase [Nocardiopsis xinjiangensis]|uniref:family 1 glycosylhydrolase n=1 Tax=Nocardiopsis xinjiangensis TaxID=124285 RepID=UPI0003478815|nr:family 1 glycosylhydrolase [Nocardiopsis xinjiangensis]
MNFPDGFLWGAATAPHQVECNNVNSDWWAHEQGVTGMERSGDAGDSYHRYPEDMRLVAEAGLNCYRFGIEWARIEPSPGHVSHAALANYRRMIDTAIDLGLTPVVTLHHFTSPRWFSEAEGWLAEDEMERFAAYARAAATILEDVPWICTINEPNILGLMVAMGKQTETDLSEEWASPTVEDERRSALPAPDPQVGRRLVEAHQAVRDVLKQNTDARVGWTVANNAFTATPGNEDRLREERCVREDLYLEAAREDDFIGVQSYSSQVVDENGIVPHPRARTTR